MRNVILVVALLFGSSDICAKAKDLTNLNLGSTRDALYAYDKVLVPEDREKIEALIGGMENGLVWANAALKNRGQSPLYCQPGKLVLTDFQIIDMMRRAIKDAPKMGDYPLGMAVLMTLQKTFPCQ